MKTKTEEAMNYYSIIPDSDTYDYLKILSKNSLDIYDRLSCHQQLDDSLPIPVSLGKMKRRGDFPSFLGLVTLSERAWQILSKNFEGNTLGYRFKPKQAIFMGLGFFKQLSLIWTKRK